VTTDDRPIDVVLIQKINVNLGEPSQPNADQSKAGFVPLA